MTSWHWYEYVWGMVRCKLGRLLIKRQWVLTFGPIFPDKIKIVCIFYFILFVGIYIYLNKKSIHEKSFFLSEFKLEIKIWLIIFQYRMYFDVIYIHTLLVCMLFVHVCIKLTSKRLSRSGPIFCGISRDPRECLLLIEFSKISL